MTFKFKIDPQAVKNLEDNTRAIFNKVIASKQLLEKIGFDVTQDIKRVTRLGKSIPNNEPLKALSPRWIKTRAKIASGGAQALHQSFRQQKSNLTLSGQLLDSLQHKSEKAGVVNLFFEGTHKPYKVKRTRKPGTRTIGKSISNALLAQYVADGGRPFMGIRNELRPRLNRLVVAQIRRAGRFFR